MEQFKKWWKKDSWEGDWDYEEYTERGWIAALGWVQSRFEFGSKVAYSNDDILMAVKKEIREELNDKEI